MQKKLTPKSIDAVRHQAIVAQTAVLDGHFLDVLSPFDDRLVAPEVDICRCQVGEAAVTAAVVVVIDERADLAFEIAG